MTDRTQNADAMSFEDLLACPHLQFDLNNELLPHLLTFGPGQAPAAAGQVTAGAVTSQFAGRRRPWLYEPVASTTVAAG